ncbi:TPA: hypothetical protein ACGRG7_001921 [Morganella morganii]
MDIKQKNILLNNLSSYRAKSDEIADGLMKLSNLLNLFSIEQTKKDSDYFDSVIKLATSFQESFSDLDDVTDIKLKALRFSRDIVHGLYEFVDSKSDKYIELLNHAKDSMLLYQEYSASLGDKYTEAIKLLSKAED